MKLQTALASALLLTSGLTYPVSAQQAAEPGEHVTVFAPYVLQKSLSGSARAPVMTVTISRNVSYQDLDLTTDQGVAALEGRVRQAAQDICHELDRRYPATVYTPMPNSKNCVTDAASSGLMQVKAVAAAARG